MSAVLDATLLVLLALLSVPVCVLLLEVVCAALPRAPQPAPESRRPRLAVVIPAHDEAIGIEATLATVMPQLARGDRLLVVADNCSDGTARIAAAAGAEVVERHDAARRGKGYALDAGIRWLERAPPELVVMVDADCRVAPGAIDRIARTSAATGRPVQALYLMEASQPVGAPAAIAQFAWVVKNRVRPLGMLRLGLPCQLMGTGMAFPWPAIRAVRLASGNIVEDLQLGIDLARAGAAPLFCPEAVVSSRFPASADGARAQRARWEHGHLAVIAAEAPRLLLEAARGARPELMALALDLCVPPLALIALATLASLALAAAHALAFSSLLPLSSAAAIALLLAVAVALAWLRFGQGVVSAGALLLAVVYAAGKAPLYLRFLVRREVNWVRSKRDGR